jgi:hypothetical protein
MQNVTIERENKQDIKKSTDERLVLTAWPSASRALPIPPHQMVHAMKQRGQCILPVVT